MPFTLAHPAAVLPFARFTRHAAGSPGSPVAGQGDDAGRPLIFSALIIGSMAPDFEYVLVFGRAPLFSHTPLGLVCFCIPAGLLIMWLFHGLWKLPLIGLFPGSQQEKLWAVASGFAWGSAQRFLWIVMSLALGAATHVLWDAVTHEVAVSAGAVPWWQAQVTLPPWGLASIGIPAPAIRWLLSSRWPQHLSSVLGVAIVLAAYWRWLRENAANSCPTRQATALPLQFSNSARRILLAGMVGVAMLLPATYWYARNAGPDALSGAIVLTLDAPRTFQIVNLGLWSLLIEITIYSLFWHLVASGQCTVASCARHDCEQRAVNAAPIVIERDERGP